MKKLTRVLALALYAVTAQASPWSGNVNFLLGVKSMDTTDWEPVEDHAAFGVMVDFKQQDWPISIALDFLGSYGEETVGIAKLEGSTSEFNAGVRKIFEVSGSSIRPFLGGGIAFVRGEAKRNNVVIDDNGAGIWLDGGIYWTLGQSFNLGFDLRYSSADITLAGFEVEAGGTYAGLLLGYHW